MRFHKTLGFFLSTFTLSLAALAGCSGSEPTGAIPEQLEAIGIESGVNEVETELDGTIEISGAEREFQMDVLAGDSVVSIKVHSPGLSDLTKIDGRDAIVQLASAGLHGERSMTLLDDAGPIYLANVGHGVDVDAFFGEGFARWGEPVATDSDDTYDWEYTPAVFKTDEGDVSVLPGKTGTLKLKGATYRVAVIAAYKVTPHPDADLPCGGISDLLSYELFRVEEAPEEPKQITRPANAKLAHLGCMADD